MLANPSVVRALRGGSDVPLELVTLVIFAIGHTFGRQVAG
jgi:hypothetical protein